MQDVRALDSRPFIPEGFGNFLETVGQGQKGLNHYGIKLFAGFLPDYFHGILVRHWVFINPATDNRVVDIGQSHQPG